MTLSTLHQNISNMISDLESSRFAQFLDHWALEEDLNWSIKCAGSKEELISDMVNFSKGVIAVLKSIPQLKPHQCSDESSYVFDVSTIKEKRGVDFIKFEFDHDRKCFLMHLRQPEINDEPNPDLDLLFKNCDDPSTPVLSLIEQYNEYINKHGDRFDLPLLQKSLDPQKARESLKTIEENYQIILPQAYKDFITNHGIFWIENEYQKLEALLDPSADGEWTIDSVTEEDRDYFKEYGHIYEDHCQEIQMIVDHSVVFYKDIQTDGLEMWVFYQQTKNQPAVIKHYYEDDYRSFFSTKTYSFDEFLNQCIRDIVERL